MQQIINNNLLDEVFVISGILKVEGSFFLPKVKAEVLTETMIILDITKTEFNNCFMMYF